MVPISTRVTPSRQKLYDVRCVVFDVYGTLLISDAGDIGTTEDASAGPEPFALVADVLGLSHSQAHTIAETYHQRVGAHHQQARSRGVRHPEVDIRTIWQEVITFLRPPTPAEPELAAIIYELAANPVWPMPGARTLLKSLTERGIRIALVSNAQYYTPLILQELLGESLGRLQLAPCIWSYEMGEAKPSPRPFWSLITALSEEEIDPGQTLYLGNDMLNDVVTAQDQGLRAVLFAGDARSLRERADVTEVYGRTPEAVITALDQLRDMVESP